MENLKKIAAEKYLENIPKDIVEYLFQQKFKGFYLPVITNLSIIFMVIEKEYKDFHEIFNDFLIEFPFLISTLFRLQWK